VTVKVIIDAFCCAGGATRGYKLALPDVLVVGIDCEPQPNYCGDGFLQYDAIQALRTLADGGLLPFVMRDGSTLWVGKSHVVFMHTSPPCQAGSALTAGTNAGREYPQLIPATRDACETLGIPYVIENVAGAPIIQEIRLCGEMFGLGVIAHRYFEFGCVAEIPEQPTHLPHRGRVRGWRHGQYHDGPYIACYGEGGGKGTIKEKQVAQGIDWMTTHHELNEAIPPAYTQWIGLSVVAPMVAS